MHLLVFNKASKRRNKSNSFQHKLEQTFIKRGLVGGGGGLKSDGFFCLQLDGRITGGGVGLISGSLRTVCASLRRKCFCLVTER